MPAVAQRGGVVGVGGAGVRAGALGIGVQGGARGGPGTISRPAGPQAFGPGIRGGIAAPAGRQLFLPPGITSTRPVYYSNGIRRYGEANGRGYRNGYGGVGYGLIGAGYGYPGFGYGELGYGGLGFAYADSDAFDPLDPNNAPAYPQGTAQDAFPAAEVGMAPGGGEPNGSEGMPYAVPPAEEEPIAPYARRAEPPVPRAPAQPEAQPAVPAPEEDAVTIVFKDGRPNEQIHNYALTRTTLFVTGTHTRSISVDQIDIAATEKLNEQAGVEFHLPSAK